LPELPPGFATKPWFVLVRKKPFELFGSELALSVTSLFAAIALPVAVMTPGLPVELLTAGPQ